MGANLVINNGFGSADAAMGGLIMTATAAGTLIGGPGALPAVTAIGALATASQNLAGSAAMAGYSGRMVANLNNASN